MGAGMRVYGSESAGVCGTRLILPSRNSGGTVQGFPRFEINLGDPYYVLSVILIGCAYLAMYILLT